MIVSPLTEPQPELVVLYGGLTNHLSAGLAPQFVVLFGAASIVKGCVGQGYRTVPHGIHSSEDRGDEEGVKGHLPIPFM